MKLILDKMCAMLYIMFVNNNSEFSHGNSKKPHKTAPGAA